MGYFKRILINTLIFISLSVLLPNNYFYVSSIWYAVLASVILSVLNMLVKPILHLFSLPITIITFGLFSFVINAVILQMTSTVVGTYHFSFGSFTASLIVAVVMSFVNSVVRDHDSKRYY